MLEPFSATVFLEHAQWAKVYDVHHLSTRFEAMPAEFEYVQGVGGVLKDTGGEDKVEFFLVAYEKVFDTHALVDVKREDDFLEGFGGLINVIIDFPVNFMFFFEGESVFEAFDKADGVGTVEGVVDAGAHGITRADFADVALESIFAKMFCEAFEDATVIICGLTAGVARVSPTAGA